MTTQQAKSIGKTDYAPPLIEGDFYRIAAVMNDSERALLKRARMRSTIIGAPYSRPRCCRHWSASAANLELPPVLAAIVMLLLRSVVDPAIA
jgi:glutaryl-CoA dehydrogenase